MIGGELQQAKAFRNVKRLTHCRLPRDVFASGQRALAAEEIYAVGFPSGRRRGIQRGPGNFHGAIPDLVLLINSRRDLKPRVPRPAFLVMRVGEINVEVYPFPLRRNFKFFVTANVLEVRTQEYFRHIPVP